MRIGDTIMKKLKEFFTKRWTVKLTAQQKKMTLLTWMVVSAVLLFTSFNKNEELTLLSTSLCLGAGFFWSVYFATFNTRSTVTPLLLPAMLTFLGLNSKALLNSPTADSVLMYVGLTLMFAVFFLDRFLNKESIPAENKP